MDVSILNKNYHCACGCGRTFDLWELLPRRYEVFPDCGLAAPGDDGWQR
jgi:hypothetical protein